MIADRLTDVDWHRAYQASGEAVEAKNELLSFALANKWELQIVGTDDGTSADVSSIHHLEDG